MSLNENVGRWPGAISRLPVDSFRPAKIPRRRLVIMCLAVLGVAVGVRLLHWQNNWLTIDNTMNKTAARYQEEARFLNEGDFRAFIRGRSAEPDTGMLIHTPGYPILIAVVHALTRNSNPALRLVHIVAGAAAAVLVLLIAVELLPAALALMAALFAAVSPQLSYYSLVLLPDSIFGLTVLLGIYLLVRARSRPNRWLIVGAGLCFGVSCWLRANAMFLAPFLCLAIPFLFPRAKWLRYSGLLMVAAVVTVAPITIRNLIVFQSLIPLTLGTGTNLMEGIADYDPGKRFGMEQQDHRVCEQEAVLYNRPDYAEDLYRPDGIQRERLRVSRAWGVISVNKLWFARVMARRAGKMLTYEAVSIISTEVSISQLPETRGGPAWRATAEELAAMNPERSLVFPHGMLVTAYIDSANEFVAQPVKVEPKSDYLVKIPVWTINGRVLIKIVDANSGRILGSATVPDSLPGGVAVGDVTTVEVPFVNTTANELKVVMMNANGDSRPVDIQISPFELYRLGPASYLWTKYPRVVAKVFQKFFTTRWMLPLTLAGALLLALARRWDALAVICAVPLYFICTHAPLHLELRYILPVHYFWGMLVATSLYFGSRCLWRALRKVTRSPRNI